MRPHLKFMLQQNISRVMASGALLALLVGCATPIPVCEWKVTPPEEKTLVGAWIGFEQDELDFVRLDLRSNSTGYCARVSPADTSLHDYGVEAYRVSRWTMDGWKLVIRLTPITTNAEPIYLQGSYNGSSFDLEMGGANGQWKSRLALFRESRIDGANQETKDKIKELETP